MTHPSTRRPFFSIIIPVFKVEPFLEQCLDSVLKQTFDDYECIVINDGSPGVDISEWSNNQDANFIHQYLPSALSQNNQQVRFIFDSVTTTNKFRLISTANQGLGIARNTGINSATGQYLIFLDGDDYFDKKFLKISYDAIIENKPKEGTILAYNQVKINSKGVYSPYSSLVKHFNPKNSLKNTLVFPSMTATPIGYFWELDRIKKDNLKFISKRGEDTIFFFDNILSLGNQTTLLDLNFRPNLAIYYYRQFDNQMSKESSFQINLFTQTSSYMHTNAHLFGKYFGLSYFLLAKLFAYRFGLYKIKLLTNNKIIKVLIMLLSKILTLVSLTISKISI